MPIPVTPKPQYPNVPNLPGVPTIPRQPGIVAAQNDVVLLASDALAVLDLFASRWGLFTQGGSSAFSFLPDVPSLGGLASIAGAALRLLGAGGQSVLEVDYRNDTRIATAPQEQGAFLSYNKVATPFNGRVTYAVGGMEAQRSAFLQAAQDLQNGSRALELLNLVMPEYTYFNVNVVHVDFRREARRGISLIVVDVWVEEVRLTGTAAFTSTQTPSGSSPVNGGTVQSMVPTSVQSNSLPTGAIT